MTGERSIRRPDDRAVNSAQQLPLHTESARHPHLDSDWRCTQLTTQRTTIQSHE